MWAVKKIRQKVVVMCLSPYSLCDKTQHVVTQCYSIFLPMIFIIVAKL